MAQPSWERLLAATPRVPKPIGVSRTPENLANTARSQAADRRLAGGTPAVSALELAAEV
jgi:hypothetical protein